MDETTKVNGSSQTGTKHLTIQKDACVGCCLCEMACSMRHFGESNLLLSALHIKADFFEQTYDGDVCSQCKNALCASACPNNAIRLDEGSGAYYIDRDLCQNCGLCVQACPFKKGKFPKIHQHVAQGQPATIKCESPVLLEITEGGPVFHDAAEYWGTDVYQMQQKIFDEYGEDCDALGIGPAGENKVRFATVQCNVSSAAGHGGFGAVMGDKKVKGVFFRRTQGVPAARNEELLQLGQQMREHAYQMLIGLRSGPVEKVEFQNISSEAQALIEAGDLDAAHQGDDQCRAGGAVCSYNFYMWRGALCNHRGEEKFHPQVS